MGWAGKCWVLIVWPQVPFGGKSPAPSTCGLDPWWGQQQVTARDAWCMVHSHACGLVLTFVACKAPSIDAGLLPPLLLSVCPALLAFCRL